MPHLTHHSSVTDQRGQTMAEYSLLIGILILAVVAAIPLLGPGIGKLYTAAADAFGV